MRNLIILAALLLASIEDLHHMEISDFFPVFILPFCQSPNAGDAAAVLGLWVILVIFVSFFDSKLPFGAGDAKLLAALAFALGKGSCIKIFLTAVLLSGTAAALILLIFAAAKLQRPDKELPPSGEIPFIPFIASGFIITVLFPVF